LFIKLERNLDAAKPMTTIFISSTYNDLREHRKEVIDILERMKKKFSAMENFGSRTDEAVPVCREEILKCEYFIGIYAWRYGWIPEGETLSITEQEFDLARNAGKSCLCYIVDPEYSWQPCFVDRDNSATKLDKFKTKVEKLVRSEFTTPDNLAKQVAADIARELSPIADESTVGSLLSINWEIMDVDLQRVMLEAYKRAKEDKRDGVVATRHVIAALATTQNSSSVLLDTLPREPFQDIPVSPKTDDAIALAEVFGHSKPFSACVTDSLQRLLPSHSSGKRLLALELAADLLKNGRGESVAKFRRAGVDADMVNKLMKLVNSIANDTMRLRQALDQTSEEELPIVAYNIEIELPTALKGNAARDKILSEATRTHKLSVLAGELIRRSRNFFLK
jgi:hypothetical protein